MNTETKQREILANMRGSFALLDAWELELKDAEKKIEQLKKGQEKHIQTFERYFPFKKGDVLLKGGEMMRFDGLVKVHYKKRSYHDNTVKEIFFECKYSTFERDNYRSYKWFEKKQTIELNMDDVAR